MSSTIWISGVTASGKTTLGNSLYKYLLNNNFLFLEFLDGDQIRKNLDRKYGHNIVERWKVLKKIVEIAKEKNRNGIITIIATVSHKQKMREYARSEISSFMEVNLICSPENAALRDYKGLYDRANSGEFDCFPGISEEFEPSENPELILQTDKLDIDECLDILYKKVLSFLK